MDLHLTAKRINQIFKRSRRKRIAVIGDVMLDKYVYGDVSRISPEAPVQILDVRNTEYKLGGAANVANNIKGLDSAPVLIGVIGDDQEADYFLNTLTKLKISSDGIIKDKRRRTTSKTRAIAHSQHILRIDSEIKQDISNSTEKEILNFFDDNCKNFKAVILQDYNKGLLTKSLINKIISRCKENNIPVLVDPKFDNFFEYKNVFVFKPNRKEIQDIMGVRVNGDDSAVSIGKKLIDIIKCEWLVLTRGENGMMLFDKENGRTVVHKIPTRARKVADVSGAGDTVISTMAVSICGGANMKEAVYFANRAAGIVCEEVGIVPIYKKTLINSLLLE